MKQSLHEPGAADSPQAPAKAPNCPCMQAEAVFAQDPEAGHCACPHFLRDTQTRFMLRRVPRGGVFVKESITVSLLLFMFRGKAHIRSISDIHGFDIRAGEMTCLPPGEHMQLYAHTDCEYLVVLFHDFKGCGAISLQDIARMHRMRTENTGTPALPPARTERILPLLRDFLRMAVSYIDNGLQCATLQKLYVEECFVLISICYPPERVARLFEPLLGDDVVLRTKILALAPRVRNTLELAAACSLSETSLKRKMKTLFGKPPYQWLLEQRNRKILFELRSNMPIKEVCFRNRFPSQANFAAYCKRNFRLTPSQIVTADAEIIALLKQKWDERSEFEIF